MKDLNFCIEAMRGTLLLSRQALQVELSVSLITYHVHGGASLAAKKVLRGIYASAGQVDCLTSDSRSYQTVNRRMDRCAKLYEHLGPRKIAKIIGDFEGKAALAAVAGLLAPLGLDSMDNVLDFVGEPRNRVTVATPLDIVPARRVSDTPGSLYFDTPHVHVVVPPEVSPDELLELARKLQHLANTMLTCLAA
jgi:hypothetical protein